MVMAVCVMAVTQRAATRPTRAAAITSATSFERRSARKLLLMRAEAENFDGDDFAEAEAHKGMCLTGNRWSGEE